jgi:biopolymer transport protein ExbB
LQGLIRAGDDEPENYRRLCESSPSPLAAVLRAGLVRAGRPLLEVEKAMEDAMSREIGAIRVRHQPLHVVGGIAPLVGLLGTVVGMIFAFYQSSQAGLGKAEVLAEYIYLALITTALGLTVAIPSMLLAAWFNARADRFMRDMDECLLDMIPVFVQMETSVSADQDSAATNRDVSTSNATLASTGSSTGS